MAAQSSLRDIKNGKVITPIVPDDSRIRMEIDELLADNEMTNLFLLALEAMQTEDPEKSGDNEDWWTFYSLAGKFPSLTISLYLFLTVQSRYSWF